MIEEKFLAPIFTDINPNNKTISIAIDTLILKDGIEIARNRERGAFVPGDIEKVKAYIGLDKGPEIDYLNAIWTEEAIISYQTMLEQNE